MSKRDEYVEKLKHKLDEWNEDIDKLEEKSEHLKADAKVAYDKELNMLKQQRENVRSKAQELIHSSEEAWDELKVGVEEAWKKFTDAIEKAHSKF